MNEKDYEQKEKARLDAMYDALYANEPTSDVDYADKPIIAPPQREWQGLTDEEIDELAEANLDFNWKDGVEDFARAIEAKLKEKNT